MFYVLLIFKLTLIFLTPIITWQYISNKSSRFNNMARFVYIVWAFGIAFVSYIPLYSWYQKNEVNVQHMVSQNLILILILILFILPFLYFLFIDKLSNYKKVNLGINILAIILLIISTSVIGFISFYNNKNSISLNNICYQNHNLDSLQLECCLRAEYVWNEGFSFSEDVPKECKVFMDWNN
jgi:hypothetical protein|tara:strand:+ start:1622 stop:2167 length:546 start_codon:yes stop_codon:yes gene_type:complete